MPSLPNQFEVFFDGECPLCKREMDMVKKKDKENQLLLTDISADGFNLSGYSMETLMREIHGRKSDGTFVTGVEVFREIYERIGFGFLVKPTRLPIVRQVLSLGYLGFAKLRFAMAMRRAKKLTQAKCSSDGCEVSP